MYDETYEFCMRYQLHFKSQYGFRQFHSCDIALVDLVDSLALNIDQEIKNGIISLDQSKAFEVVNNEILFQKLKIYSNLDICLKLLKSYLDDRRQLEAIDGTVSHYRNITSGQSQGLILGLLTFIIYIMIYPWLLDLANA